MTAIDNESSTVEHVVVAGSTATRGGWTPVVPVNVLTGGRAKSTGATVALPVDGVIPVWTVACVIVAHAIGVVSAEVLARLGSVDCRLVGVTLTVCLVPCRTHPGRVVTDTAVLIIEGLCRHGAAVSCASHLGTVGIALVVTGMEQRLCTVVLVVIASAVIYGAIKQPTGTAVVRRRHVHVALSHCGKDIRAVISGQVTSRVVCAIDKVAISLVALGRCPTGIQPVVTLSGPPVSTLCSIVVAAFVRHVVTADGKARCLVVRRRKPYIAAIVRPITAVDLVVIACVIAKIIGVDSSDK